MLWVMGCGYYCGCCGVTGHCGGALVASETHSYVAAATHRAAIRQIPQTINALREWQRRFYLCLLYVYAVETL